MKKKGFTLIELLVVIAIIGLLTSIVLVLLGLSRSKAKDSRRFSDFRQINTAMELCYQDPSCAGGMDIYPSIAAGPDSVSSIGKYLPLVPKDPVEEGLYQYTWTSNAASTTGGSAARQYYCAYVKLEVLNTLAMMWNYETFACISNLGVKQKTSPFNGCTDKTTPCNDDCCGMTL
jgi:prepilin-type N-terminal cleavage/methylation domain-containing protein